jgi:hypothetical protein
LVQALTQLPSEIKLRVTGYETIGARGHVAALSECAGRLGVADRFEILPAMERADPELMRRLDSADVGICLLPLLSSDANLEDMAGASNKAFEYLARGLALLLPARAEWVATYGDYGVACDPNDAGSITRAIAVLSADRSATLARGEAGRQRIIAEWNYEREFEPMIGLLHG